MLTRTSRTTVAFGRPFVLSCFDDELPPGTYDVETDEELLQGVSFPAYRRILTLLHVHARPGHPRLAQTLAIDPNELDSLLARDAEAATPPPVQHSGVSSEPDA